jgi:hypothetical protein
MRVLFVSHPFGGQYSNYKKIKNLIEMLNSYKYTGKYVFVSPVLMFAGLYGDRTFEEDIEACKELLDRCDGILMCGDWKNSVGCMEEYRFALDSDHLTISELNDFLEG